jgi:hypothetical protein
MLAGTESRNRENGGHATHNPLASKGRVGAGAGSRFQRPRRFSTRLRALPTFLVMGARSATIANGYDRFWTRRARPVGLS